MVLGIAIATARVDEDMSWFDCADVDMFEGEDMVPKMVFGSADVKLLEGEDVGLRMISS